MAYAKGDDAEGRSVSYGSLYTVQERLDTFTEAHWPYDSGSCTVTKMAEAGFYFCGTEATPDWVRCVVCHHEMDGWEEEDEPWNEHKKHRPDCPFVKKVKDPYNITVGEAIDLEKEAVKFFFKDQAEKLRSEMYRYWDNVKEELRKTIV